VDEVKDSEAPTETSISEDNLTRERTMSKGKGVATDVSFSASNSDINNSKDFGTISKEIIPEAIKRSATSSNNIINDGITSMSNENSENYIENHQTSNKENDLLAILFKKNLS